MIERPYLAIVGGFLGAGKTTLILAAARELEHRGIRSAVILNDQGESLVDTEFARASGMEAAEVTGGCFCCRFSELMTVAELLREHSPAVIFAEPVGSCTDISATILQPLRTSYAATFQLAPFTVLVDPERARALLKPNADPHLAYLFEQQWLEADLVCFTKSDLWAAPPKLPGIAQRLVSALTGQGVVAWLDEILSCRIAAGSRVLNIDYEQYARAEAALAWLNLRISLETPVPVSPSMVLGPLLDGIDRALSAERISIVHLKAVNSSPAGYVKAAICANGQEPAVEGSLDASPAMRHEVLLNLRAAGAPERVRQIVEHELATLPGRMIDKSLICFAPSAPKPEYRMSLIP